MQQFKKQFLGETDGLKRAATAQKCLRTDDLDRVGVTAFHHTFFEMLGNFSFGDYFKKDAISWAWEFLTKVIGLPKEKLWVSVYHEDKEAKNIWLNDIKLDPKRIVELGDKSNFWPSEAKQKGPNGPCGPCSEIFYDYGSDVGCRSPHCDPDCSCGRFAEVWNLVFTQFNRKEGGILEPLPNKNIDTGMGLERLAAVVQGKKTNFDIDLFEPILSAIDDESKKHKITLTLKERYVIADHMRAIVFAISDGVIPSNEGRGYVVKRLIADVTDIILEKNKESFIHKLVPAVVVAMKDPYEDLVAKKKIITDWIKKTEDAYKKVRQERIPELKKEATAHLDRLGEIIFKYRDTYGLTLSSTGSTLLSLNIPPEIIEREMKIAETLMNAQREKSRASSKMTGDVFTASEIDLDNMPKTEFVGYDQNECKAKILNIFVDNKPVKKIQAPAQAKIILDKTPFYGESGGQVGDTGILSTEKTMINVLETNKTSDIFIHTVDIVKGGVTLGDTLKATVDKERRLDIMRNHTATHLLQSALRAVLGDHVQQQGSLVAQDRLRFDFTHPKALDKKELLAIEDKVNAYIQQCIPVSKKEMSLEEAKKEGALAFFAEKYHAHVRVINIDGASKELCGGTHLDNTGQIGILKILGESAIAQGIRRIEATTGRHALDLIHKMEDQIEKIAKIVKSPKDEMIVRLEAQTNKIKELERDLSQAKIAQVRSSVDDIIKKAKVIGSVPYICAFFETTDIDTLRKIMDMIKQKTRSAVVALGGQTQSDSFVIIFASDDLVAKNIKANDIIARITNEMNGSGGGRPQMAQAGTKEKIAFNKIFQSIEKLIKEKNI